MLTYITTCRSGPGHVNDLRANLLSRGVVRCLLAGGTVFDSMRAFFFFGKLGRSDLALINRAGGL